MRITATDLMSNDEILKLIKIKYIQKQKVKAEISWILNEKWRLENATLTGYIMDKVEGSMPRTCEIV